MHKYEVVRLTKTLSVAEKRYFKVNCKKQSGDRIYLALFDTIDQTPLHEMDSIELKFKEDHPSASFHATATYLVRMIADSLVKSRCDKDGFFMQMQGYMRAKVLFDKAIISEGFKELKKSQRAATVSQNHLISYMTSREELDVLSFLNFQDTNDDELIKLQMKAKATLKTLLNIQEHHSLFEILKIRLTNTGNITTVKGKQHLNDLLLSELSLITGKVAHNFESAKLHLLFQSYYFTSTGDYNSSLKTFASLNNLFESNINNPKTTVIDYLSSLEGILDSLRTLQGYDEMPFYIKKIKGLVSDDNMEYFNQRIIKAALIYELNFYIAKHKYKEALKLAEEHRKLINNEHILTDYEQQWELLFNISVAHFNLYEYEKALKYISKIIPSTNGRHHSTIYKASRLLTMFIRYELGYLDFISYEIRAYKRLQRNKTGLLNTEKLVFKVLLLDPNNNSLPKNKLILKQIQPDMTTISESKYDLQVTKYFNFLQHITDKLSNLNSTNRKKSRARQNKLQ